MSDEPVVKSFAEHGHLLPPPEGTCPQCGRDHAPEEPHDARSMHYQYWFLRQRGRWPTWEDAIAHCPKANKEAWRHALRVLGVTDEEMGVPE